MGNGILENLAASLTNIELGTRLRLIVIRPRSFSKLERETYIMEAAKRLDGKGK